MTLAPITLDDKYALEKGRVFLTGTQALVRLPMLQRRRDERAGLSTACFISGYRGSPLGGLDRAIWQARSFVERHGIHFRPGVNEDLAATAVWGSQQASLYPGARYDGVFAMWYGKGPGVDRSGDAFKHANMAGTARHGGVLAIAGDDHICQSSTLPHQSEYAFVDAMMPVLNPAGVQEFFDFGLLGWALSRYAGLWVGFKAVADTVESAAAVWVDPHRLVVHEPQDFEIPEGGLNIRWPDPPLEQERRLHEYKIPAALAFARANGLDRTVIDGPRARLGIVTTGKSYLDVRQALEELGIGEKEADEIGLRLHKVGLSWPLEPEGARRFANGLEEVLVVEEKRPLIESQLKALLYEGLGSGGPRVVGKRDERGEAMLASFGELNPSAIARVLARRIARFHRSARIEERIGFLEGLESRALGRAPVVRLPYFCSGCPHNSSTRLPEGSRGLAGIGCHYMVQWMDRDTQTFTQMGGEGANWIGQAPFSETGHVFQNIGDGTYYHSGLLAIRAAVAAGVNITYKLLYNDAVAMTGGQPVDGPLNVPMIVRQLEGEGVERIALVSDSPEKCAREKREPGVTLHHRDDLDRVQRDLRDWPGVSVLIYDQMCATEMRRRRKRGLLEDPARHVFINTRVCEGCGDCGRVSNCLSVVPVETEFGRKRAIDVSSCNKDESCVEGFCPSFAIVKGARPRRPEPAETGDADLKEPAPAACNEPYGILIAGIGGTGVVTIGALLGMAAHLEGKGATVLDHTGLAQKYGAVFSHVRIAEGPEALHAVRIASGGARLLLGCDLVVAASPEALEKAARGRTKAVVNAHGAFTGDFTRDPDAELPKAELHARIVEAAGKGETDAIEATRLAAALTGEALTANVFLLGFAYQKGLLPVGAAALEQAIRLNAVAVDPNLRAFRWGRMAAEDRAAVERRAEAALPGLEEPAPAASLEEAIARRVADLTAYQSAALAERYRALVERVRALERERVPGREELGQAVARSYHKLLAYKDEYEVARLYTDGRFLRELKARFDGDYRIELSLAPPILGRREPETGHLKKRSFGPWILTLFRALAKLKGLRGTPLDLFGYLPERRRERRLIAEYEATVAEILGRLKPSNHALAVEIAELPQRIRGFGHVKEAAIACAKEQEARLLEAFRPPSPRADAAA